MLDWGEANRRAFPWRDTRDPWRVLTSEVMLQQTQAPRVVAPYERWVERFPDPPSCAQAGPGDALRAWEGLGYNGRAVRLHRAAVAITERHGGAVPAGLAELEALPGVGPYTARAVLVFAFEADVGVVDTNVRRLLSRAVAGRRLTATEAQDLADDLVPPGRSWAYNQTLFDIGVVHCQARHPRCEGCPLAAVCAWRAAGPSPDPAHRLRRQAPFDDSDRQGRGRLVAALRRGPLERGEVPEAAGCADDPRRAWRIVGGLVADGLARRSSDGRLRLP